MNVFRKNKEKLGLDNTYVWNMIRVSAGVEWTSRVESIVQIK